MRQKDQSAQIKFLIKINSKFKIYYFRKCEITFFTFNHSYQYSFSQFKLQLMIQFKFFVCKIFIQRPILITVNGIFQYKSDWIYLPFNENSFKKEITEIDELNHANFFTKLVKK